MNLTNDFLKECNVENLLQYDALEVWNALKINSPVTLTALDGDKRIAIMTEQNKALGTLSENDSASMLLYVQMGYADIFSCKISYKSDQMSENLKLKVVIKIKKR